MARRLLVTGTDTGVGKTLICCALARALRNRGMDVGVMKPVASGAVVDGDARISEDAALLQQAAQVDDPLDEICPVLIGPPLAPIPAAEMEGVRVRMDHVRRSFSRLAQEHEFLIVEGIGGLLVPLVRGLTVADLAGELNLPILIVARSKLGTINHTLLTIEAARARNLSVVGVVFNRLGSGPLGDDERTGPAEVVAESGVVDLGLFPWHGQSGPPDFARLAEACEEHLRVDTILSAVGPS